MLGSESRRACTSTRPRNTEWGVPEAQGAKELFRKLEEVSITTEVRKETILFRRREPLTALYTVRRGRICLLWENTGRVHPLYALGPGSVIGLSALLKGVYSITAKTVIDCELGFIEPRVVTEWIKKDPHFSIAAARAVAQEAASLRSTIKSPTEK